MSTFLVVRQRVLVKAYSIDIQLDHTLTTSPRCRRPTTSQQTESAMAMCP